MKVRHNFGIVLEAKSLAQYHLYAEWAGPVRREAQSLDNLYSCTADIGCQLKARLMGRFFFQPLLLLCGVSIVAGTAAHAETDKERSVTCATDAFRWYNDANLKLLTSQRYMTPEARQAQRRLQERYCAEFAQCSVIGIPPQSARIPYATAYSQCLRDEEKESSGDSDDD